MDDQVTAEPVVETTPQEDTQPTQEPVAEETPTETPEVVNTPAESNVVETLTVGEHLGTPQPDAPPVVPATAYPAQDAVTINGRLHKVADDLTGVVEFIRTTLSNHEASEVVDDLESIITKVRNLVK